MGMTNEQLISQAVDCLTVVIESPEVDGTVRRKCYVAREEALSALRVVRIDRINEQHDERATA